jgi:predicted kinase
MNLFRELVTESSVKELLKEDHIFIMVIGGVASGKSYFIDKNLRKHFPVVDIDECTEKESNGDWEKARKLVSKCIKITEDKLKDYFKRSESVVNQGSGASIPGVKNKLTWAKEAGMKTAIILVDVPLETALKRNQERANKGDRNLIPDYKVEKTNTNARENFKEFSKIADYSIKVKS